MKNKELLLQERIRAVIAGEASEAEKQALLQEASTNPEVADELAFSQSLARALRYPEAASAASTLRRILEEEGFPPPTPPKLSFWKNPWTWAGGAALITLLAIGSYFLADQQGWFMAPHERLAWENIRPLENVFFLHPDSLPVLKQAMDAYDEGRYTTAAKLLEKHLQQHNDNVARLYLGVCYLLTQQPERATIALAIAAQSQEPPVQETALWYLSLAYLQSGRMLLAQQTLESIPAEGIYGEQARELLEKIQ